MKMRFLDSAVDDDHDDCVTFRQACNVRCRVMRSFIHRVTCERRLPVWRCCSRGLRTHRCLRLMQPPRARVSIRQL